MAIAYFLKLDGIQGECTQSKHKDEIDILNWSWGATNPVTPVGAGMSAGKVAMVDLHITKRVDKSSPKLLGLIVSGKHIGNAVLTCAKSTGDKTAGDFLTLKLEEAFVSSFQTGGGSGQEVETESITLAYGKITYDYKQQDKAGTLTSAGTVGYDLMKGEQV